MGSIIFNIVRITKIIGSSFLYKAGGGGVTSFER